MPASDGGARVEHATRVRFPVTRRRHPIHVCSGAACRFDDAQIWKSWVFSETPRGGPGGSPETARESRAPPGSRVRTQAPLMMRQPLPPATCTCSFSKMRIQQDHANEPVRIGFSDARLPNGHLIFRAKPGFEHPPGSPSRTANTHAPPLPFRHDASAV